MDLKIDAKFLGESVDEKIDQQAQTIVQTEVQQSLTNAVQILHGSFVFDREYEADEVIPLLTIPDNARVCRVTVRPEYGLFADDEFSGLSMLTAEVGVTGLSDVFSYRNTPFTTPQSWVDFKEGYIDAVLKWHKIEGGANPLNLKIVPNYNFFSTEYVNNREWADGSVMSGETYSSNVTYGSFSRIFTIDPLGATAATYTESSHTFSPGATYTFRLKNIRGYDNDGEIEVKIGNQTHTFDFTAILDVNEMDIPLECELTPESGDTLISVIFKNSTMAGSVGIGGYEIFREALSTTTQNLTGQKIEAWLEYIQE